MANFCKIKIKSLYNAVCFGYTGSKALDIPLSILEYIDNIYTAKFTKLFLNTRYNISYTSKISLSVCIQLSSIENFDLCASTTAPSS